MNTQQLHYSQCGQPSALPTPQVVIPHSEYANIEIPYEAAYNAALNSHIAPAVFLISTFFLLAGLTLCFSKGKRTKILLGVPVTIIALMIATHKAVELGVPRQIESLVANHQYLEAIDKLNYLYNASTQTKSYSILPDFVVDTIEQHQLHHRQFNSYVLAVGIKHYLSSKQIDDALSLADKPIKGDVYTEDNHFRAIANWEASRLAHQSENTSNSLNHARAAYEFHPNRTTHNLLMTATAAKIVSNTQQSSYDKNKFRSLRIDDLSIEWQPEKQSEIIEYIARNIFTTTIENNPAALNSNSAFLIDVYTSLHRRFDQVSKNSRISTVLQCDLAGLYNAAGTVAFKDGNTEHSISNFLNAEKLLLDAPYTSEMLPLVYTAKGKSKLSSGNSAQAVTALMKAYQRHKSKKNACNLATGINEMALDKGEEHEFDDAFQYLSTADSYCPGLENTQLTRASLHLSRGELALSNGQFSAANYHFDRAQKHQEFRQLAYKHTRYIPKLKSALSRIRSINGVYKLPKPDGIICSTEGDFCEHLLLMKHNRPYGVVNSSLNEIYIHNEDKEGTYLAIFDSDNDKHFEQWSFVGKYSEYIYIDTDLDNRPDWFSRYSEGKLVEEKPLSGVVAISLRSAINHRADAFSEPDSYYKVFKNNRYIGRSDTVNNQTYATYKRLFVVNYKYQDEVRLDFYDEDIFFDDKLGVVIVDELPTNRFLVTNNQKVAVAMKVVPTDAPEGTYLATEGTEQVNPFIAESWAHESSELAEIIKSSRQKQSNAQFAATLASFVLPEAILSLTVRRITLFNALIVGVAGHEVTHEALTHTK